MAAAIPYNTGKVRIGSNYRPVVQREMSRTEIRLQRALLAKPRRSLLARLLGR
jgi:hypothetical protein